MPEFLLRHSNVSLTKLGSWDDYLRPHINNKIGSLKVTNDPFYLQAWNGGFGFLSLKDGYYIWKIERWVIYLAVVLVQHIKALLLK
jgi:hypothetical protein